MGLLFKIDFSSAADLYIKDYLAPAVEKGNAAATPLRVLYRHRWKQTVHPSVLKYCLQSQVSGNLPQTFIFHSPTKQDVESVRVVVTTLSSSHLLLDLGIDAG